MKTAFVVGFFDPVKNALEVRFPKNDRLIWVDKGKNALVVFKERFYEIVKTADGLLVCLGRAGSERHLEDAVAGIIGVAKAQYPATIQFNAFGNLYDPAPVVALVESFGIETETTIGVNHVRSKVTEGTVLCVSLEGKTTVFTALQRAGVSAETLNECFIEEIIQGGKNSNLMQYLKQKGQHHSCLLYAWAGLRTSTPEVKAAYKFDCHEAPSAAQVVEMFRKWTMGV